MLMKLVTAIALTFLGTASRVAVAQQVTFGSPAHAVSQNFFSHFGTSFQFQQSSRDGFVFFRHPGTSALPPFGGFHPDSGSRLAVGGRKGNASWRLGVTMAQGSSVRRASVTPGLTLPNGGFGLFQQSIQRPFVVGFVPVVGNRWRSPVEERLERMRAASVRPAREGTAVENEKHASPGNAHKPPSRRGKKPDDPPLILTGSGR